jgi:CheY-like chemotaxis protein
MANLSQERIAMSHILIVEDNRDIAVLYQRALFKYQHTIVATAKEAIEALRRQKFDLVILDLHLPEMSGLRVLQHIRSQPEHTKLPVLVISADDVLKHRCEDIGIQKWMTKPIEIDVFMETVDRWLQEEKVS